MNLGSIGLAIRAGGGGGQMSRCDTIWEIDGINRLIL